MPVTVAISFPTGRFHATPWGHHVNEALPEWPPSPWRFLRALVAVWKRKLPPKLHDESVMRVLTVLTEAQPKFFLPPATLGHTRHFMPTHKERTKVFDAFISLSPGAEVVFHWPDTALSEDRQTLALLLSQLGYFGRAESWCAARLLADYDPMNPKNPINCSPGPITTGSEAVRVLTACSDGPGTTLLSTSVPKWNDWSFGEGIVRPDPSWNLLAETTDLHQERWSDPPGSKWVTYARPANCFAISPAPRPVSPGDAKTEFILARYVLDVAEGRRPLPLVTETLPFAEEIRRQLGREYARVIRSRHRGVEFAMNDPRLFSPIIHGKDEHGVMAKSHGHAFYLPTDEDQDGRLDHITVFAAGRFSRDDLSALDRLRTLSFGKEGDDEGSSRRRTTHRLLLIALDRERSGVWDPASVWVSATPYIAFRHMKNRGQSREDRKFASAQAMPEFMKQVLAEDWNQRSDLAALPKPIIEFLPDPSSALGWKYRSLQFRRARNRPGDDGYSRSFGAFRLAFPVAITGPISLGYASHFGMGAFRPVVE